MDSDPDSTLPRALFLNRSYWPDAEATGQLLTELCEDLSDSFQITVVAGQPNQNPGQAAFRKFGADLHEGVQIRRVWHTQFSKRSLLGKVVNLLSYTLAALWTSLRLSRPDVIVVETDPPLLCFVGAFLQRWWKAKLVVYLQDIYPDVAIALGKIREGRLSRLLRKAMFYCYRRADRVVVLSRDMRTLLVESGIAPERIRRIPNWVDTTQVFPSQGDDHFRQQHGIDRQFLVMYSGNMGLCQRLEDVVQAAEHLRERNDILFLLIGDGVLRPRLEADVANRGLSNVRFLPYQPKAELRQSLNAADLHLVPLDPRVTSCLMPSKLYGILAAGCPLLAVAPGYCELAKVTRKADVGLVVSPCDPQELAKAVRWGVDHRSDLIAMGANARNLAEERYDRRICTREFRRMLRTVLLGKIKPRHRRKEPLDPQVGPAQVSQPQANRVEREPAATPLSETLWP